VTKRVVGTCVVAVLVATAAIGCSNDKPTGGGPTPGPSASPTSSADEQQQAKQRALAAYNGYRDAYVSAAADPNPTSAKPELAKFTADPLLNSLVNTLALDLGSGIVNQGHPVWKADPTAVNVATRPYSVTLRDCFDSADWTPVYKATGKSAAVAGQAKKYTVTAKAVQFDDGAWRITEAQADRNQPC
jgi:hypothetical protein